MNPVGYLTSRQDGFYGARGDYYDYITAGNGVFIEAEGPLMAARLQVSQAIIRGLKPLESRIVLRYGLIPQRLFDLALSAMLADPTRERFAAITWDNGYHLRLPDQDRREGSVDYRVEDNTILDLHSHAGMGAFFSGVDNEDEQGMRLYGVVGRLNRSRPIIKLRAGIYGYYQPVDWGQVFSGYPDWSGINEDDPDILEIPGGDIFDLQIT